jgi:hypothetical protein
VISTIFVAESSSRRPPAHSEETLRNSMTFSWTPFTPEIDLGEGRTPVLVDS